MHWPQRSTLVSLLFRDKRLYGVLVLAFLRPSGLGLPTTFWSWPSGLGLPTAFLPLAFPMAFVPYGLCTFRPLCLMAFAPSGLCDPWPLCLLSGLGLTTTFWSWPYYDLLLFHGGLQNGEYLHWIRLFSLPCLASSLSLEDFLWHRSNCFCSCPYTSSALPSLFYERGGRYGTGLMPGFT
jgi:hypothetical protein